MKFLKDMKCTREYKGRLVHSLVPFVTTMERSWSIVYTSSSCTMQRRIRNCCLILRIWVKSLDHTQSRGQSSSSSKTPCQILLFQEERSLFFLQTFRARVWTQIWHGLGYRIWHSGMRQSSLDEGSDGRSSKKSSTSLSSMVEFSPWR